MGDCLIGAENDGDCLAALATDVAHSWHKGEIIMQGPLELYSLICVVFDGEVESFLFLDDAIPKGYLVFFLRWQILKQYLLSISLTFYPKPH